MIRATITANLSPLVTDQEAEAFVKSLSGHKVTIKGFRLNKEGKLERIVGFGQTASQKQQARKSKKVRVVKGTPK